jgi:hypothetical protein
MEGTGREAALAEAETGRVEAALAVAMAAVVGAEAEVLVVGETNCLRELI